MRGDKREDKYMDKIELRNYTSKDLKVVAVKSKMSGVVYIEIHTASNPKGEKLAEHYYLQPDIKLVDC